MDAANPPRLIRLHPADNVLTVGATIPARQPFTIDGNSYASEVEIPLGFKIASMDIPLGGKVIKYGAPIGSANCDIHTGDVVHTHNLRSDYLPTFARGKARTI